MRAAPAEMTSRTPGVCEDHTPDDGPWVHLRVCLTCGHVGCCDSSPARHASVHYERAGHPVMRSAEAGESWRWCFVDQLLG
ncbi:MAG TPA: UBP-type zinc finger domain-containing protein [Mycobacteriales bacterium]|nr:UBP-type zinc finger domain-containing protein [Mycobacteriales bacterium]